MTDEISIQQQKPSMAPYVLTGGVLGAAAGTGAAYYTTSPKYNSYEDIIKEAKDKFETVAKEEISDETAREKALKAYETIQNAGKEYDEKLEAYKEANKGGEAIVDSKLVNNVESAKNELDKTKNDFVANIRKDLTSQTTELHPEHRANVEKQIRGLKDSIAQRTQANEETFAKINEYIVKSAQNNTSDLEEVLATKKAELDAIAKNKKLTPEEIRTAKNKIYQDFAEYTSKFGDLKETFGRIANKTTRGEIAMEAAEAIINTRQMNDSIEAKTNAISKLGQKFIESDFHGEINSENISNIKNEINKYNKLVSAKNDKLSLYKDLARFNELTEKAGNNQRSITFTINKIDQNKQVGEIQLVNPEKLSNTEKNELKEIQKRLNNAQKNNSKVFEEVSKLPKEELNSKIEDLNNSIVRLNNDIKARQEYLKISEQIKSIAGEGAKIEEYVAEDGKKAYRILGKDGKIFKPTDTRLQTKISMPANYDKQLDKLNTQLANAEEKLKPQPKYSEAQIEEAVNKALANNKEIASKQTAYDAAKKALEEAKANAKKTPTKTVEELTKEFVEKNGTLDEAIKKATDSSKDDLARFFEKSLKMNSKTAMWAGGLAVAGMALGALLAPKSREA